MPGGRPGRRRFRVGGEGALAWRSGVTPRDDTPPPAGGTTRGDAAGRPQARPISDGCPFPRPAKEDTRYSPRAAEVAYWLLGGGTALRVAGELARTGMASLWLRTATLLACILQVVGLLVFFYTMWSRIRPVGSQAREAQGERF